MSIRKSPINKIAVVFIVGVVAGYFLHVMVVERQVLNKRLEAVNAELKNVEDYLVKTQQKISIPRPAAKAKDKEEEAQ